MMRKKPFSITRHNKEIKGLTDIDDIRLRICGPLLGRGLNRDVYEYKPNPEYVVKVERDMTNGIFANATEWRNYIDNMHFLWLAQWLAPIELITTYGDLLIQRRVIQDKLKKEYPLHIPSVFTDTKYANFGWIGDQFVCCDYSFLLLMTGNKKMKRAKWWDHKQLSK